MRSFGMLLIVCGILLVLVAYGMNTSVSSFGAGEVNNLGLLQQQMMVLQTGLAMFVAGSVLLAGGAIHESNVAHVSRLNGAPTAMEGVEDREERLAGVRRLNRIIGFSLLGALGVLIVVIVIASGG